MIVEEVDEGSGKGQVVSGHFNLPLVSIWNNVFSVAFHKSAIRVGKAS